MVKVIAGVKVEVRAGSDVRVMEEVKMECANAEAEGRMAVPMVMERDRTSVVDKTSRSVGAVV